MILNLMGLLLLYLKNFCSFSAAETVERSFKGAVRVKEGCFFTDTPLISKRTSNVFACTHTCLANTLCISIAFCEYETSKSGRCHLFNKGIQPEETVGNSPSLVKKKGCTFYQFVDVSEGCNGIKCQNGGSCYHDNEFGGLKCACVGDYGGDYCDRHKTIVYRFTNLKSTGRTGPTSQSNYTGTTVEGRVTLLQGKQKWSVPFTGRYHFDIQGASGGDGKKNWHKGGKGARVSGYVSLTKTTSLVVVIGQQGVSSNSGGGGGGGGSFVFYSSTNSLIGVAGGGGGGGGLITQKDGKGGLDTQTGGLYGGRKGLGGTSCTKPGYPIPGGGGGYASNGLCFKGPTCNITMECDAGGGSFKNGFLGGKGDSDGGFGGGGAGNDSSPGGGGGYSGGGVSAIPEQGFAGGGGSFTFDSSWNAVSDYKVSYESCPKCLKKPFRIPKMGY